MINFPVLIVCCLFLMQGAVSTFIHTIFQAKPSCRQPDLVWNDKPTIVSNPNSISVLDRKKLFASYEFKSSEEIEDEEENEFDGYAMRDAIYAKFGKCFDMEFRRVDNMGKRDLYLNVMPFHLNSRRFRHATEYDYLCHLQAIVEILIKYDRLDYVLAQMQETTKMPRASTSPLIAVPFRLDLSEDTLDFILGDI